MLESRPGEYLSICSCLTVSWDLSLGDIDLACWLWAAPPPSQPGPVSRMGRHTNQTVLSSELIMQLFHQLILPLPSSDQIRPHLLPPSSPTQKCLNTSFKVSFSVSLKTGIKVKILKIQENIKICFKLFFFLIISSKSRERRNCSNLKKLLTHRYINYNGNIEFLEEELQIVREEDFSFSQTRLESCLSEEKISFPSLRHNSNSVDKYITLHVFTFLSPPSQ